MVFSCVCPSPGLPGLSPAESELLEAILGVAEKVGSMAGKLGDGNHQSHWKMMNIYRKKTDDFSGL